MRTSILALGLAATAAGCNLFKQAGIVDDPPAHTPPNTTSIWGEWVLATDPDSTAFAGAEHVQLDLRPGAFLIVATYPRSAPVEVRGEATWSETGVLTLVPSANTAPESPNRPVLSLVPGRPITLLASAAGATLLFSPPERGLGNPSSVWHSREMAERAGRRSGTSTPPPR